MVSSRAPRLVSSHTLAVASKVTVHNFVGYAVLFRDDQRQDAYQYFDRYLLTPENSQVFLFASPANP